MENNYYIPNNNMTLPQEMPIKKKKSKKWILIPILSVVIIALYIGYTFLLGGGRLIGTWQLEQGGTVYEYTFKPFGFGEKKTQHRNNIETKDIPIHWEYDDTTKCLIIIVKQEAGDSMITYKVVNVDGDKLILSNGSLNDEGFEYIKK